MIFKIILLSFLSITFFSFYKRKLTPVLRPTFVIPIASVFTLISLAPMGWIIGLIGVYALPKLMTPTGQQASTICAKCGTLSKKGESSCRKCKNALN